MVKNALIEVENVRIGPLEEEECAAAAAIHREALPPGWNAAEIADMLAREQYHGLAGFAAAGEKEEMAGFILWQMAVGEADLVTLAVASAFRRRGVARVLLDSALAMMAQEGAGCCFLEVAERNEPARRLYAAQGFEVVGRRPRYYQKQNGLWEDALMMRCDLTASFPCRESVC